MYQSQFMPYAYPWQQPAPQIQQPTFQQQQQPAFQQQPCQTCGRTVASMQEITPQEVPMDGTMALFPLADGSAVIGKRWDADGTIKTVSFKAESQDVPADVHVPGMDEVMRKLDRIESFLFGTGKEDGHE